VIAESCDVAEIADRLLLHASLMATFAQFATWSTTDTRGWFSRP